MTFIDHVPAHGPIRKRHKVIKNARHQNLNESKTTSSLFFSVMIAKIERTLSSALPNTEPHKHQEQQ